MYTSPPPNDGALFISDLVFGKRDYDNERAEYYRRKRRNKNTPHWRRTLSPSDPYALMPIFLDPTNKKDPPFSVNTISFDPYLLEAVLTTNTDIFNTLLKYTRTHQSRIEDVIAGLANHITIIFKNKYKRILFLEEETSLYRQGYYVDINYAVKWQRTVDLFESTTSVIIARWCLERFTSPVNSWIDNITEFLDGVSLSALNIKVPRSVSITGDSFELDGCDDGSKIIDDKDETFIDLVSSPLKGVDFE